VVLIHSGLLQAGVYVVRPMGTYQALNFGVDVALIGVIGAAFALAPLVLAIPVGRMADKGFAGTALFMGPVLSLLATVGLIFADNLWWLLGFLMLLGVGHLHAMVGGQTLIAQRSSNPKYERNFGLLTFYASAGHAVGPLIGGLLANPSGSQIEVAPALWFAAILFIFAALASAALVKPRLLARGDSSSRGSFFRVVSTSGYKPAIFVAGATTSVLDVMLIFLPVVGLALGFSPVQIGSLLAIRALASMGVRIFLGKLSAVFGMKGVLIAGLCVTLSGCIGLGFVSDFWLLATLVGITGLAMGIGQPLTMAWVSRIAPRDSMGMAISVRLTSNRLGQVAVPALAGLVAAGTLSGVFFLMAGLMGVAATVTSRALSKTD